MKTQQTHRIYAAILFLSLINCDTDPGGFSHDERLQEASAPAGDDPLVPEAGADDWGEPSLSEGASELLWLASGLYDRHLAGYPGGPSPFESDFARMLDEDGVSREFLAAMILAIDERVGPRGPRSLDEPVDGQRITQLLLAAPPDPGEASGEVVPDITSAEEPSASASIQYKFKFESVRSLRCGDDHGTDFPLPCDIEEPFVIWGLLWPTGHWYGVTDQAFTKGNGAEVYLSGALGKTTSVNPTAVMLVHQVLEADPGHIGIQAYVEAIVTAGSLVKASIKDWSTITYTSWPQNFKDIWNFHVKQVQNGDDGYALFTRVYKRAELEKKTSPANTGFMSECMSSKKPTGCAGDYALQSMNVRDDGQFRVAHSISAIHQ